MTLRRASLVLALTTAALHAESRPTCDTVPHMNHPRARIGNGELSVLLFLPDAQTGYYRSSRFDWSGVIACASFQGHILWGEWFRTYDPLENDSITGPVEEFRPPEGAQGFDTAATGGVFVKIGVGVLRRDSSDPYSFGHRYPIVDHGRWTTRVHHDSVTFRQQLHAQTGIRYDYTKTVSLEGSTVVLTHSLHNRGSEPLRTDVYDHDFYMLDGRPTGPGFEISFPFVPVPSQPFEFGASIDDRRIVYQQPIAPGGTVDGYLTGYNATAADNRIMVENTDLGFGVEQTETLPLSKLYLWSIPTTICPEAYIHLDVAPGKTVYWTIRYRLFTK